MAHHPVVELKTLALKSNDGKKKRSIELPGYCNSPILVTVDKAKGEAHIDPYLARFDHQAAVEWKFRGVPRGYQVEISAVSFQPHVYYDAKGKVVAVGPVSLRLFETTERSPDTFRGTPYLTAGGTCWYEVVLRSEDGTKEHRLRCSSSYMGGIIIDPPPPG